MSKEMQLVSICIPNYNYGRYLKQCLESVLNQTYTNIEVIFRDNASTDNSMEIAYEYQKKFKEKGIYFSITQNKRNVGSDRNSALCLGDAEGMYIYTLASDDAIHPEFVERCVEVFTKHPNVGMVITNRSEMDDDGKIRECAPFYNTDCVIKGEDQAAVFMMAGIGIPGQRMVKRGAARQLVNYGASYQVAGDWFVNFRYACTNDIAYLTAPLCWYRVHFGNETSESELNLLGIFEHYRLINQFVFIAEQFGLKKVVDRYDEAVKKLGSMCLRYTITMLKIERMDVAEQYMNLALFFDEDLENSERYQEMLSIMKLDADEIKEILKQDKYNTTRTVSYDPPSGYYEV